MATTASEPSTDGSVAPDTDAVRRLAVDAGKYLGKEAGDSLPIEELRLQAEANGYDDPAEVDRLLADAGVHGRDAVTIPEQGDLFGDLWSPNPSPSDPPEKSAAGGPGSETTTIGSDRISQFRGWCQSKVDNDATRHSYSRRKANRRYAQALDVDRWFQEEYDTFSTVFITFVMDRTGEESIAEHAGRFYPDSVTRKRTRILRELDSLGTYAGVSVLAPKHPPGVQMARGENHNSESGVTHAHGFWWIPGRVTKPDVNKFDRVTDDGTGVDVSVETWTSAEVTTPESVTDRGSGLDNNRGPTTPLPRELGDNLPLLHTRLDARGLPDYAEEWCAAMRLGTDDSLGTPGVKRFQRLGRFRELASAQKWKRDLGEGARDGARLRAELLLPTLALQSEK